MGEGELFVVLPSGLSENVLMQLTLAVHWV